MARGNLLNTSDVTLKTLLGNGMRYSVPPYQRDYSWKEEHWEDLWLDLVEVSEDEDSQHYMGAVVLQQNDRELFTVIDGQQRLATLSIVVLAAVSLLEQRASSEIERDDNSERARLLRDGFLGTKDPGSLRYSSKLSLNRNDDTFYQGTLLQLKSPQAPSRLPHSNRLLWQAFGYFRSKLAERFPGNEEGGSLARFINEAIAQRLLFIRVQVDDDLSAYTVFETLNARGLDLTASDLLKNYLMALVARRSETDLKHVLDQWSRITDTVGIRTLPDFLRHHLNSRQPFVRQERLFKAIKADVRSAEDVFALLDELERSAVLYQALQDPYDPYWVDLPVAKEQVRILNLLGVKQFKSLALSTGRKLPDSLQDLLRFCVLISVRYTIIGDLNPSELERVYNEVAVNIERGTLRTTGQIREALREVAVSDEDFRDAFSRRTIAASGRSKKVVRYILCALERQLGHPDVKDETCAATIEHILPENLGNSWEAIYSHDQHERFVNRLGNYTLLDPSRNRDLGNLPFPDKMAGYQQSGYKMTSRISATEWTPDLIEARQREMAGWAATVWKF
jgi:Protein of unknown function DUF262/Protein of unknown function (DUF1524)